MTQTIKAQYELGYETAEVRRRRTRMDLLRRAGIQPAAGSLDRRDRNIVKPYPKWLLRLGRLIP